MRIRIVASVALAIGTAVLSGGCSGGAGGRLGELKRIADTCPHQKRAAQLVSLDVRGELRGAELTATRLRAVQRSATRVAVCGGRLRVVVFSVSWVASVTVFDDTLAAPGATENARLRRVDGIVADAMKTVEAAWPVAVGRVSSQGGDPLGQFEAAAEFASLMGEGYEVRVLIETSGESRAVRLVGLDRDAAVGKADHVVVPDLSGVAVLVVAGLGRVGAGPPPRSNEVAALSAFYQRLCERTGAVRCVVVSDVDPVGV